MNFSVLRTRGGCDLPVASSFHTVSNAVLSDGSIYHIHGITRLDKKRKSVK